MRIAEEADEVKCTGERVHSDNEFIDCPVMLNRLYTLR